MRRSSTSHPHPIPKPLSARTSRPGKRQRNSYPDTGPQGRNQRYFLRGQCDRRGRTRSETTTIHYAADKNLRASPVIYSQAILSYRAPTLTLKVNWAGKAGTSKYKIQIRKGTSGKYKTKYTGNAKSRAHTISGLRKGTYYVRMSYKYKIQGTYTWSRSTVAKKIKVK